MDMNITGYQPVHTSWPNSNELSAPPTEDATEKQAKAEQAERGASKPAAPQYDEYVPGEAAASAAGRGEPESKDTKCTTNTDQVEAEIRKLKEERDNLQQQLDRAANDPEKSAELKQALASVEMELRSKDNDAYKRQHASYTFDS